MNRSAGGNTHFHTSPHTCRNNAPASLDFFQKTEIKWRPANLCVNNGFVM